jgi:hypothetical protein
VTEAIEQIPFLVVRSIVNFFLWLRYHIPKPFVISQCLFDLLTVDDYDDRSGVPESTFCQDNQGLGMRKRRKKRFAAQQMLMLLNQLAHNLIRWIQHWMIKAMKLLSLAKSSQVSWWTPSGTPSGHDTPEDSDAASETLSSFGMKRLVSQVLCLSGEVTDQA